jgi:protein SCO1/2
MSGDKMSTRKNRIALTVGCLLAFAALFTGLFVSQHMSMKNKKIDPSQFNGTLLESPREIEAFHLTGTDEAAFTNQSLQGNWTMIFFGFTQCGYLCPTTLAELAKMYRTLEQNGVKPLPRIVMITLDPERDSLEKLKQYSTSFHPSFFAARGEDAVVKNMTREMGVAFAKVSDPNSEDAGNYDIQHSGAIMLFNPKGQLTAFFTTPHQETLLAKDYTLLINSQRS